MKFSVGRRIKKFFKDLFEGLKKKRTNQSNPQLLLLKSVEIDIGHNDYDKNSAKRILQKKIMESYRSGKKAVLVIHGFNSGTVMKDMVHNELNMKAIKRKYKNFPNPGTTLIELNEYKGE